LTELNKRFFVAICKSH